MTERTGIRAALAQAAIAGLLQLPALGTAAQASGQVALAWHAPEECPDRDAVLAALREHDVDANGLQASATITHADDRYRLVLHVSGPGGAQAERTLEGADCAALTDAAALLIALALERQQHEAATAHASAGSGTARTGAGAGAGAGARGATIAISPDNELRERPGSPPALRVGAGVALALDAGTLPRAPAFALEPRVQLQLGWLRSQLALGFWLARSGASERYASAELSGSGVIARLALGVDPLTAPLALGPRALFELGRLAVETDGVSAPARSTSSWIAVGAGVQASLPIAHGLAATLELGALFPFARPRWLLRTGAQPIALFTASPAVLRAGSGLAYTFW